MTKLQLYALVPLMLQGTFVGVFILCLLAAATALASGQGAASSLAIVITPAQAPALPDRLDGLEILVDTSSQAVPSIVSALADIADRGGRPGVLVPAGTDSVPAEILAAAHLVLVDASQVDPAANVDQLAFNLKTRFTTMRAARGGTVQLGIAGRPEVLEALLARDAGAYADLLVWLGRAEGRETGLRVWRTSGDGIERLTSVVAARQVARGGRAERWLFRAPDDLEALGRMLRDIAAPSEQERFSSGVVGARTLGVEEIIARHQAAAARQAARIDTLISTGTLTLTFEAPGFPAPVTISSDTIVYTGGGRTELEQRRIRVNGIAFQGGGVPRLPIIEPERVASPPLAITLSNVYRYRLSGEENIGGVRCYAVEFRPINRDAPLFSGRAWIAADSFAMVRVSASQTGLRGAIVSSEQQDEFREHEGGLWLLARSDVRQMYEGAAHRTPIHRVLAIETHAVNAPDFEARRQNAYASDSVMLRDTPEGFRYLRRDRPAESRDEGATRSDVRPVEVVPEVAGRADRVRTLAAGVIIDPNISIPLPFAGLSYVDFNLFGTGAQFNGFFGGSYGQAAFSIPSLGGRRWHLAGRAFGIASSYNDRAFAGGREQYEENIRQRPAHASVWLLRPLTAQIALRAGYELDYTHFAPTDITSPAFTVPASQVVHGARIAIEAQRAGWNASLWWNPAARAGWRPWGIEGRGDYEPRHATFQRYGVSVNRSAVITPRLAGRVEGAWMGGRDLDRFSRYTFGTFENRLRGYPSALIRYDRGGVARVAFAWSVAPVLRLDGFLDSSLVRDPAFGRGFRRYTGIGAALEAPAPFGLLLAAEWGYGLRGVNADGSTGTHVVRVSAFKIF